MIAERIIIGSLLPVLKEMRNCLTNIAYTV